MTAPRDPSYLATYGITNPWTIWLLRQSELLAEDASSFGGRRDVPPRCPGPHGGFGPEPRMNWRPGAFKCYLHDEPVVIEIRAEFERAPQMDVLSKLDKVLDYVWQVNPATQRGAWVVIESE